MNRSWSASRAPSFRCPLVGSWAGRTRGDRPTRLDSGWPPMGAGRTDRRAGPVDCGLGGRRRSGGPAGRREEPACRRIGGNRGQPRGFGVLDVRESHARESRFMPMSRLLRGTFGVDARRRRCAGTHPRDGSPDTEVEDLAPPGPAPSRSSRPCGAVARHCARRPKAPAHGSGQRGVFWRVRRRLSTSSKTSIG